MNYDGAFRFARQSEYLGLDYEDAEDRKYIGALCGELVEVVLNDFVAEVEAGDMAFDSEEDLRTAALEEAFIRAFETGFRLGQQEGAPIEVTVQINRDQIAGLVQRALG